MVLVIVWNHLMILTNKRIATSSLHYHRSSPFIRFFNPANFLSAQLSHNKSSLSNQQKRKQLQKIESISRKSKQKREEGRVTKYLLRI